MNRWLGGARWSERAVIALLMAGGSGYGAGPGLAGLWLVVKNSAAIADRVLS